MYAGTENLPENIPNLHDDPLEFSITGTGIDIFREFVRNHPSHFKDFKTAASAAFVYYCATVDPNVEGDLAPLSERIRELEHYVELLLELKRLKYEFKHVMGEALDEFLLEHGRAKE
jgi:hypothetical protein